MSIQGVTNIQGYFTGDGGSPDGEATWRSLGALDFTTMTPTTVSASPVTIDGVTFTQSAIGAAWSATVQWAVSASGLRSVGADVVSARALLTTTTGFLSEVLDPDYNYAYTVEISGVPTGASGEMSVYVGEDENDMIGIAAGPVLITGAIRAGGGWGVNQTLAHGGALRQYGLTVLPGCRAGAGSFTPTAPGTNPTMSTVFAPQNRLATQAVVGFARVVDLDTMLIILAEPASRNAYIEKVTIWTDKPAP